MTVNLGSETKQMIRLEGNTFNLLNVTFPNKVLDFNLMKSNVSFISNSISNSNIQQFIAIDAASNIWMNGSNTLMNITNNGPNDESLGLFTFTNTLEKVQSYNFKITDS